MRYLLIPLLVACAGQQKFHAKLDTAQEIPPPSVGDAAPSGTADFVADGGKISYQLSVAGLSSPFTGAHIHGGAEGALGLVVVPLQLGSGVIDASMIKGTNPDASPMTMNDLLAAMKSGGCYVNIHTQGNPKGEIRGQLHPAP
jgi:hypothetical protein